MTETLTMEHRLVKKDFESDQDVRWCPGCGDYAILAQVQKILPELSIPREKFVFVSGIGCSSRFPYYMETYGFHSIHGRAPAIATGVKVANPDLSVWVMTGDGDGLSIGGNHLVHAMRRNLDINIILFNNQIYGLTKGQYSPTSEVGKITKSSPFGSPDHPLKPLCLALGAEATFAARTVDRNVRHMESILRRAAAHRGTSFVEVYQNCVIFNNGAFSAVTDKHAKVENELLLEHGKPLRFGPVDEPRGVRLDGIRPEVVSLSECDESELYVHDEKSAVGAFMLSRLEQPDYPVPIGVFLDVERPTYEETVMDQERKAKETGGKGGLQRLLRGPQTWTVA